MSERQCQNCEGELPKSAEFCPFCGQKFRATSILHPIEERKSASVATEILYLGSTGDGWNQREGAAAVTAAPSIETSGLPGNSAVNHEALARFRSVPEEDPLEDFDIPVSFRSRTQIAAVSIAILLMVGAFGALGYIAVTGFGAENSAAAVAEVAPEEIEEPATVEPPLLPELLPFETKSAEGKSAVYYGEREVLKVTTAKGSRYNSVMQRADAIKVRLKHIADKQRATRDADARFVTRMNGDRYEVVWDDGSKHPFRITDVTRHDLDDGEDLAIEANLTADSLTELFRSSISPIAAIPTS